jgi:O-antigen/teichoic acid export membrane protein
MKSIYLWGRGLFHRFFQSPLIRRIIKNSGYLLSATGLSAFMSMLQGIMTARLLGPTDFGVLGAITVFTSTVNRFASFRMNELVVRYVGYYQERSDPMRAAATFKSASILEMAGSLIAFILIMLFAPFGATYIAHDSSLTPLFRVYGFIVLANLITESANGLLQIFDRFQIIALITTVQSTITLLLIAIAFFTKAGLMAILLAYMCGKIIGALAISAAALWQAGKIWGSKWWLTPIGYLVKQRKSLLTFAFSTNISSTISLVAKDSDVLWVSAFLGTTQAGYYKLALAISNILQLPISPLPKATFPELSREIARHSWENVRYILRQGSRLAATYSLPVTLSLVIFGQWLISLFYGSEFLPAYPALVILLIGYTFANIFYWNRVALLSLGRPVFPTIVNFIGMVMKVGGIFLLVPRFGYLVFAGLLSGYYIFTVGISAARVALDLRSQLIELEEL